MAPDAPRPWRWPAVAAAGLLATGCAFATNSQHPGRLRLTSATVPELGQVLVDGKGRTLYLFAADPPNRSTCFGACASIWPPVTTQGRPGTSGGVQPGLLTTVARSDGPRQIVYAGHPLYYYQADTGSGEAQGQGITQFGSPWFALTPQGQIKTTGSADGRF
ncbi:COG4315 family predicted lipoprotein [Actinomadura verrucosospora]|uniref:Lipoprotein n=1 Tax=Actinomadura verrucosospora TaxID=46165 RepID=A0A7D4A7T8_ACTVE|nr:hypothetical protein [Actinomadura verrucosospora]QKG23247.1 Lipoprotein [Actinomadura verrucosospora]